MRDKERNRSINPTTEDEIRAVTIGEIEAGNASIRLDEYSPAWPQRFLEIDRELRDALGSEALQIEHVGSTSVPGLSAKPIIDVLLVVSKSSVEESYVPRLEGCGFSLRIREPDWYEHRLLKPTEADANIHVFSTGCREIIRLLTFRDWLRINESDRAMYQNTKKKLAARTWKYTQNYADAKTEIIEEILTRALAAYGFR
jgi:GrpB-like predicted nucleotidyltransferase (UPF0157 family)